MALEMMISAACAKRGKQAVQEILSIESQIQSLHDKVDRLLEGEYYKGRIWLMEAEQAIDEAERNNALDKARDRFVDAEGPLRGDDLTSSFAALYVYMIDSLLGRRKRAVDALERAHNYAIRAAQSRCKQFDKLLEIGEGPDSEDLFVSSVSLGLLLIVGLGALVVFVLVALAYNIVFGFIAGGVALSVGTGIPYWIARGASKAAVMFRGSSMLPEINRLGEYVQSLAALRADVGGDQKVPHYEVVSHNGKRECLVFREIETA